MAHESWEELERRQSEVAGLVPLDSVWEHFRTRDQYIVIGHCIIEATDEGGVLYRSVHHPAVTFPRAYSEWVEQVEVEGATVPRFRRVV